MHIAHAKENQIFMKLSLTVNRLILLVLLAAGMAACAGKDKVEATPENMTEQLREEILNIVRDVDRASQAAELTDQLKQIFVDAHAQSKVDIDDFHALNRNFDATDAGFNAFFDGINSRGRERQSRVLKIHVKMKSLLTAKEWAQLEDAREDALKVDIKLL